MNSRLSVEDILEKHGPGISSRVTAELMECGVSAEAARQQVSRTRGSINRLHSLAFPKKEKFLYLDSQFGSFPYWEALKRDLDATNSVYGAALHALNARGGIVPKACFGVISGAPVKQKGQVGIDAVVARMEDTRLIRRVTIDGYGECVALDCNGMYGVPDLAFLKARLATESVLLFALRDWVRKLAMVSYNKVALRDLSQSERPTFGTCQWDMCGPSYLRPFVRYVTDGKLKPGFIVCDAYVTTLGLAEIKYFVRKCRLLGAFSKMSPFLPVLVADRYSKEAFAEGRRAGILMATPETLFGSEVAAALSSLLQTLTKAAAVAAANPDKIYELFSALGRIEGAAGNLRGALFEMIVGFLVREREGSSIDIGERITDPETGRLVEIDIRRVKERQECWVYECKAHQPTELVTQPMVKTWVDKMGIVHSVLRREQRFQGCRFGFEYWTCGDFEADALDYLKKIKSDRPKLNLGWRNGAGVREYASHTNRPSIIKTLDEHYFRHPVRVFERSNAPAPNFDHDKVNLEEELA